MDKENGIPKKIHLQIGDEVDLNEVNFNDLDHENVTWCQDRIFKNDLEYIFIDEYKLLKEQFEDVKNKNLEIQEQLSDVQSQLTLSETKVKLNYNNAVEFEKQLAEAKSEIKMKTDYYEDKLERQFIALSEHYKELTILKEQLAEKEKEIERLNRKLQND